MFKPGKSASSTSSSCCLFVCFGLSSYAQPIWSQNHPELSHGTVPGGPYPKGWEIWPKKEKVPHGLYLGGRSNRRSSSPTGPTPSHTKPTVNTGWINPLRVIPSSSQGLAKSWVSHKPSWPHIAPLVRRWPSRCLSTSITLRRLMALTA